MRGDKFDWAAAQWGKTKATNFFSKLAAHLGSTGLNICMHKAKAHRHTHTEREGVQIKPEQCNCNWLTQQQHSLRRSVRFRAVKQTLALHFLYCCHSRETEMATEVEAETPTETRLPAVHRSLMYLYLFLSLSDDLPVALFFWSHCCCNLVTLCFIFITHTKLLHIKKVKFSVSFFSLPLPCCCFALIAPRLSFQQKLHEMGLV